jgi:hypothetical protein
MAIIPPIGIIRAGVRVFIQLEAYEDNGTVVCLIHTLSGKISLPPREWVRAVRDEITKLERIARSAGCAEMRIEGRNWSRVLRGLNYHPWPEGEGYGLRKAL